MPSKYWVKGPFLKEHSAAWAPVCHFDERELFRISKDGTTEQTIPLVDVLVITGNTTLTPAQNGTVVCCNAVAGNTITLPSASLGKMKFIISLMVNVTSNSVKLVPASTDAITGNQFNTTGNKYAECAAGADVAGDFCEIQSDGVTTWYLTRLKGTWTKET